MSYQTLRNLTGPAFGQCVAELPGLTAAQDMAGLRCLCISGFGCIITGTAPGPVPLERSATHRMDRVAAHIAAGLRLRRAIGLPNDGEAVLGMDGRVHHATGAATDGDARERLRSAVRALDRARGPLRRRDELEALNLWQGLVSGKWTLVDRFESDGKHYVIAHRNEDRLAPALGLAPLDQQVAAHAATGQANKLIAYQLGLNPATVSTILNRVCKKLRLESKTQLAALGATLGVGAGTVTGKPTATPAVIAQVGPNGPRLGIVTSVDGGASGLESLSQAELACAQLVVAGSSNLEIARTRGVSPRTVANQLASVYQKLGLGGRAELAARLGWATKPRA